MVLGNLAPDAMHGLIEGVTQVTSDGGLRPTSRLTDPPGHGQRLPARDGSSAFPRPGEPDPSHMRPRRKAADFGANPLPLPVQELGA
jgi:hypothetical protein